VNPKCGKWVYVSREDNRNILSIIDRKEPDPDWFNKQYDGIKWYILYDAFDQPAALMYKEHAKKEAMYLMFLLPEEMWSC